MNLTDKIILITGSTDGIGKQTALELAMMGANVIVHGRNNRSCERAANKIIKLSGNKNVKYITADFSSLSQIRNMAVDIKQNYSKLDVLINNAGVYENNFKLSEDGFELTFAVNHLAHFLLTNLLLELLVKSAPSRIINVSSIMHAYGTIDFENLNGEKYFDGSNAYAISKAANVLFTYYLSNLFKDKNVAVNTLHSGIISTKLLHKGFSMGGGSLKSGAATSIYLASSDDVEGVAGRYFVNSTEGKSAEFTYDEGLQKKLWEFSIKLTKLPEIKI